MPSITFCPRCGTRIALVERYGQVRPVCPACDYTHFDDPKVAAVAWIERQTVQGPQVLLVQRGAAPCQGLWALPAGYIDRGEEPRAAAARETREETGLTVEIDRIIEVFLTGIVVTLVFAARLKDQDNQTLQPGDDAIDARWFSPDALPELAFESTKQLVARWIAQYSTL